MVEVCPPIGFCLCTLVLTYELKRAKKAVDDDIEATDASALHRSNDETTLIHELVAQYLAHDGYIETARAFAEEVQAEKMALSNQQEPLMKDLQIEEDQDATHRQCTAALTFLQKLNADLS